MKYVVKLLGLHNRVIFTRDLRGDLPKKKKKLFLFYFSCILYFNFSSKQIIRVQIKKSTCPQRISMAYFNVPNRLLYSQDIIKEINDNYFFFFFKFNIFFTYIFFYCTFFLYIKYSGYLHVYGIHNGNLNRKHHSCTRDTLNHTIMYPVHM